MILNLLFSSCDTVFQESKLLAFCTDNIFASVVYKLAYCVANLLSCFTFYHCFKYYNFVNTSVSTPYNVSHWGILGLGIVSPRFGQIRPYKMSLSATLNYIVMIVD